LVTAFISELDLIDISCSEVGQRVFIVLQVVCQLVKMLLQRSKGYFIQGWFSKCAFSYKFVRFCYSST